MKKTLLTIIITLAVAAGIVLLANAIWTDGGCIFSCDDDKTECSKEEKKECCDKDHEKKECCDKDHEKKECCDKDHGKKECCDKKHDKKECCHKKHGMICESYKPIRAEFDAELSDDEKATIADIKEKFAEIDHTEMCPETEAKFMEEHKADFEALTAIADNHKEYFDAMMTKMHEKKKDECKHAEGEGHADDDGEVVKDKECPEAHKCKDAVEKCKGEKTAEAEEKCKEEEKKCEHECMNTFMIHFLLLDFDKE